MKKSLQIGLGLVVSGVCLYLALKGIAWPEVWRAFQEAELWILVAVIPLYISGFFLRSIRWSALLNATPNQPSAKTLFPIMMIGFLGNNVLPLRAGEFIRAHWGSKKAGVGFAQGFSSLMLERAFDLVCFVTLFGCISMMLDFPPTFQKASHGLFILLAVLGVFYPLIVWKRKVIAGWIRRQTWIKPSLQEGAINAIEQFAAVFVSLKNIRILSTVLLVSAAVWGLEAFFLKTVASAFDVSLSFPQAFFYLVCMGVAVALPQAPGFVGVMEYAGTLALGALGIPRELGLSITLTIHAIQFVVILVAGLWGLTHEGLSLRKINPSGSAEASPSA